MAENKKKPESTPKPSKDIPKSKMQNIPPTPKPSKGMRLTATKAELEIKNKENFPQKKE